jgi:hypothetical protein
LSASRLGWVLIFLQRYIALIFKLFQKSGIYRKKIHLQE